MTHIFIGCTKYKGKFERYAEKLSALEVHGTFNNTLSAKELAALRTNSPKGFAFTMKAPKALTHTLSSRDELPETLAESEHSTSSFGLFQNEDATRAAWEETLRLASALSPKLILIQTPIEFSPGPKHTERLEWFAKNLAPQAHAACKAQVAWQPHGLWDLEETLDIARSLKLVPTYDPFAEDDLKTPRGTALFALHQRRGLRARFDEFDMEELFDKCSPCQRAIITFRGIDQFRDARLAYTTWKNLKELESLEDDDDF